MDKAEAGDTIYYIQCTSTECKNRLSSGSTATTNPLYSQRHQLDRDTIQSLRDTLQ
jgi:hypothetical protein